jgi:hypothetical protein
MGMRPEYSGAEQAPASTSNVPAEIYYQVDHFIG